MATTDIVIPQRDTLTTFEKKTITGSGNLGKAIGFNSSTGLLEAIAFANAGATTNITSLSGVTSIVGGASNMTITAGTGNSRTLVLQSTTSGGVATTALTLNANQSATFVGQVISTLATGTAPFSVASTTNVANLNASTLNGSTFASPGAIGGTTPAAGTFTTGTFSGDLNVSSTGNMQIGGNGSYVTIGGTGSEIQLGQGPDANIGFGASSSAGIAVLHALSATASLGTGSLLLLSGNIAATDPNDIISGIQVENVFSNVSVAANVSVAGIWIKSPLVGATAANRYGLLIGDVTGATNNYAISTGAGKVDLRGVLSLGSPLTTVSDSTGKILSAALNTVAVANGGTGLTGGTSGGVLAYTASGTLASSTALTANAIVIGGGAGAAPSTTTTGTGVLTALGVNTGSAGAFVVNGGAMGTPSALVLTNATVLPLTTGVTGTLPVANGGIGGNGIRGVYIYDDFLGAGTSAATIGALGWGGTADGAAYGGNTAGHPGIFNITSNTNQSGIYGGYLVGNGLEAFDGLTFEAVIKIDSITNVVVFMGYGYVNSPPSTNGAICLHFDPSLSANWRLLHYAQGGAATYTDTGRAAVAGDWVRFKLALSGGTTTCTIATTSNTTDAVVTNSGAFTNTTKAHCPQLFIDSSSGAKVLSIDAVLIHGASTRL